MTLQEAITVLLDDESIEDFIYNVRDRALQDGTFTGNSWDHPRVSRYSEAITVLRAHQHEVKP